MAGGVISKRPTTTSRPNVGLGSSRAAKKAVGSRRTVMAGSLHEKTKASIHPYRSFLTSFSFAKS